MSAAVLRWHNPGWAAAMPSRQPGHRIWPTAVRGTEYNALRDRDHESWNVLFDQEAPAIYRYALSRLGDAGLAASAALGTNALPMNAAVEVESIFEIRH